MSLQSHTHFSRVLRNSFLSILVASSLAVLAYSLYSSSREQKDITANLEILSGFLAYASQSFFDDVGNGLEPLSQLIEQSLEVGNSESARPHMMKFQILHPEIAAMALFAPSGEMLLNTAVAPGGILPDFRKDPSYINQLLKDMKNKERYTLGRPEFGKAIGKWRFAFRYTTRDRAGNVKFLIQAAIPLDRESTFLHKLPIPPESFMGLLRLDGYQQARWPIRPGTTIYGKLSKGPVAQIVEVKPDIRSGVFGGVSPWSAKDGKRIGAFTRLEHADMYAYISVPESFIMQQWWRHNWLIIICLVIGVMVFAIGARRVALREQLHSKKLLDLAKQDVLTGLPNRAAIDELVQDAISIGEAIKHPFGILFVDLDRFKNVNDVYGHDVGDQLIISAAKIIQKSLRNDNVLGRFGGDEYMILLNNCNIEACCKITERILAAFQLPLLAGVRKLQITPSIGVAVYPEHGLNFETLTKHADTAMYEAKRRGGSAYAVYTEEQSEKVRMDLDIEHQLRYAIAHEEFKLVYQPIVDLTNGRMVGLEALLRWQSSDGQFHSPLEFIGIAEESGLIIPIGDWVLREACGQLKKWNNAGYDFWIAVNLSVRQFRDTMLVDKVSKTIKDSGIKASSLELEITESAAMLDPEMTVNTLGRLKEMGLRFAIDDFGTGYSSLSYLKRIPADKIKIDKSFVDGINAEAEDTAIVTTILALVNALEKTSLAEGIETEEQFHTLRNIGCQYGQGYWMSRPVDAEAINNLLHKTKLQLVSQDQYFCELKYKEA